MADGALSVLLSLLASVTGSGKHAAIIGLPKLGLLAATEMEADLVRCALISHPGAAAIDVATTSPPPQSNADIAGAADESTVDVLAAPEIAAAPENEACHNDSGTPVAANPQQEKPKQRTRQHRLRYCQPRMATRTNTQSS